MVLGSNKELGFVQSAEHYTDFACIIREIGSNRVTLGRCIKAGYTFALSSILNHKVDGKYFKNNKEVRIEP